MTSGTLAGLIISDQILGRHNPYTDVRLGPQFCMDLYFPAFFSILAASQWVCTAPREFQREVC